MISERSTIYLIDDEEDVRESLRLFLAEEGAGLKLTHRLQNCTALRRLQKLPDRARAVSLSLTARPGPIAPRLRSRSRRESG